jgi:signal peptidase I
MIEPAVSTLVLETGSMHPTFPRGSRVLYCRAESIEIGEVAVFRAGEFLMVHRVVARVPFGEQIYYVHCGDGSKRLGLFHNRELLGRVTGQVHADCITPCERREGMSARARLFMGTLTLFDRLGMAGLIPLVGRQLWGRKKFTRV